MPSHPSPPVAYTSPPSSPLPSPLSSPSFKLLQRLLTICGLAMLLMVPLELIRNVISERASYRAEAVARVVRSTAEAQRFLGPLQVLTWEDTQEVPVTDAAGTPVTDPTGAPMRELRRTSGSALRRPQRLHVTSKLVPSIVHVGLFEVAVYEWRASVKAAFDATLPRPAQGVTRTFGRPLLLLGISDVRGLVGTPALRVDGQALPLEPGPGTATTSVRGIHAVLPEIQGDRVAGHAVELEIAIKGTHSLELTPVADDNHVVIESSWPHPRFEGFSPRSTVGDHGFVAEWRLSALASTLQGRMNSRGEGARADGDSIGAQLDLAAAGATSSTGSSDNLKVSLVNPVDVYTQADRASKYGILFVALTFLAFFLFEVARRLPIHPMQYLLVGLALAMFFLLLLSLSERIEFGLAYSVSSAACIGLQGIYLSGVLRSWGRAAGFAVMLTALYGVLYCLLASEDSAFLMGSLLLFSVLAAVMWFTRKLDWYGLTLPRAEPLERTR